MFLENCDLPEHTHEMRTHQRLPDCHQTVQEVLGVICRSTSCVCSVIQLIITVTSVAVNVFFVVVINIIFTLNNLWIRCYNSFRFSGLGISRCQRSITPLCTESFYKMRKLPTVAKLSPSAPVVPLVANTDANSLEVRPYVSASKIPRMFSCRNPG